VSLNLPSARFVISLTGYAKKRRSAGFSRIHRKSSLVVTDHDSHITNHHRTRSCCFQYVNPRGVGPVFIMCSRLRGSAHDKGNREICDHQRMAREDRRFLSPTTRDHQRLPPSGQIDERNGTLAALCGGHAATKAENLSHLPNSRSSRVGSILVGFQPLPRRSWARASLIGKLAILAPLPFEESVRSDRHVRKGEIKPRTVVPLRLG